MPARSSRPVPRGAVLGGLLAFLGLLAALLAPVGAAQAAQTAQAAAPSYVALGDSYSSGTGTRSYLSDGTSCQRSVYAYPSLLAAQKAYALNFRACSGATIPDVTNTQLGALGSATRYVTLSVGGNDAGFADVLTECATPWWAGDCDGAIDAAQAFINGQLPGRLATLYSSVRSRATTAKVVIVGYPRIFNGEDCNAGTWFSPAEEARLNQTADLLNSKLSAAGERPRVLLRQPHQPVRRPRGLRRRRSGSTACPTRSPRATTPTAPGTRPATRRSSARCSPAPPRRSPRRRTPRRGRRATELAAQQRQYAAQDAAIEPRSFRAPDLTTPRARRAADRAGIDLDRWLARHP